ncbi:hypothetical protein CN079_23795 [Sinorhizobium medicae]|nr:hypothetical protein CN078_24045 [Sinorhizobium medicae]RVP73668.1 hypothetical protein CN079_23795 [Sinorhizobium medicae]
MPSPQSIEGRNAGPVAFNDGQFWFKNVYLGELRTDPDGGLLFLGGEGKSASFRPGVAPLTFANNVGWHDDIADGPVFAKVTFAGQTPIDAEPGYVAVTPPNYAPGIAGLITMDDTVREMFYEQGWIERPKTTSFTHDVWPIFDRLTGLQLSIACAIRGRKTSCSGRRCSPCFVILRCRATSMSRRSRKSTAMASTASVGRMKNIPGRHMRWRSRP